MVGSLGWSCNGCNGCARILKSDTGYQISHVTVGVGSPSEIARDAHACARFAEPLGGHLMVRRSREMRMHVLALLNP